MIDEAAPAAEMPGIVVAPVMAPMTPSMVPAVPAILAILAMVATIVAVMPLGVLAVLFRGFNDILRRSLRLSRLQPSCQRHGSHGGKGEGEFLDQCFYSFAAGAAHPCRPRIARREACALI